MGDDTDKISKNRSLLNAIDENGVSLKDKIFMKTTKADRIALVFLHYQERFPDHFQTGSYEDFAKEAKGSERLTGALCFELYAQGKLDDHLMDFFNKKIELFSAPPEMKSEILREVLPESQLSGDLEKSIYEKIIEEGRLNQYMMREIEVSREFGIMNSPEYKSNLEAGLTKDAARIAFRYRDDPRFASEVLYEKANEFYRKAQIENDPMKKNDYAILAEEYHLAAEYKSLDATESLYRHHTPKLLNEMQKFHREMMKTKGLEGPANFYGIEDIELETPAPSPNQDFEFDKDVEDLEFGD